MRRRRTAASSLDAVETVATDPTATELLASDSPRTDLPDGELSDSTSTSSEPAPAKPRRTRRPKAISTEDSIPQEVAVDDVSVSTDSSSTDSSSTDSSSLTEPPAEAPKRPRRSRRTAVSERDAVEETVPPEQVIVADGSDSIASDPSGLDTDLPMATATTTEGGELEPSAEQSNTYDSSESDSSESQAEQPLPGEPVVDEQPTVGEVPSSLGDLLAESEAILEEVLNESALPERSSRSRRNNRRGRGRDRNNSSEPSTTGTPEALEYTGPIRKRGPKALALTAPLPTLSVSLPIDTEGVAPVIADIAAPARKRGIRTPRATRRILTPDGVTIVSEAQAAALLGTVLSRFGDDGIAPSSIPLQEVLAPTEPEYMPLPQEILEKLPQVTVALNNAVPTLSVNGSPVLPAFLFVNTEVVDEPEVAREIAVRQIRRAYASGVRLFTLLANLPWRRKAGDRRFDSLDNIYAMVAEAAPDAFVLPRLIFSPPLSWERANPDEMAAYASGEPGDVSLGSDLFWNGEAKDTLRAAIEYLAQSEHAARTLGIYLEHGEWFQPKGVGADQSPANRAAFQAWLKHQYRNNEVALRSAWYDGSVTFDTAEIPSAELFASLGSSGSAQTVFLTDRETRVSDFFAYTSITTADRITQLAAVAKEASGGRIAVATSYGYTLEIARPNCGHYALADVLASPAVDILTAPISYEGRLPGGVAPLPMPVDSVHLAGKLFILEDDTKTHLAQRPTEDAYNPKVATEEGTQSVHARNVGMAIAKGCGISWMDLWGEGWLDDDATWNHLGDLIRVMETVSEMRRTAAEPVAAPHVAVFVDEQSLFDVRGDEEPALLPQLIGRHRASFARAGASVGYYLMSDLLKPEFPESPRLFIFLNAFHLPVAIRTALQNRWQNNGRTFAWLFAPGVREAGNIAELSETIGLQLRLQAWGSRTGTVVTDGRFPLTENAKGERFGEEKRVNPSLTIVDPKAQVLGEYVSSGNPSLAYRKHARWQSVFIGERDLPLPLIRGLYRLAGVPVVTPDDEAVHVAGDGFIAVHSAQSTGMTVYSPTRNEAAIYDVLAGEPLAGTGYGARTETIARTTRLLICAPADTISTRFAVAAETWQSAPPALEESELPVTAKAFVFEGGTASPPGPPLVVAQPTRLYPVELSVSAEDIAQFEAALSGEIALLDKEGDSATESEANRKKRRRRRRRGGRVEENGTDSFNEAEDVSDDEGEEAYSEMDLEAADAVFTLADLTQSASSFDADALLPLLSVEDATGNMVQRPEGTAETSGDLSTDPVADMMARLFALPNLPTETQNSREAEGELFRRPTLDELLPFSEAPVEETVPDMVEEPLASTTGSPLIPLQSAEPADTSTTEEASAGDEGANPEEGNVGLLASTVRERRTRSTGAGGFTARLRRRNPTPSVTETPSVETPSVETPMIEDHSEEAAESNDESTDTEA